MFFPEAKPSGHRVIAVVVAVVVVDDDDDDDVGGATFINLRSKKVGDQTPCIF